MDPTTAKLFFAAGGAATGGGSGGTPLTEPLLFPCSQSTNYAYVHGIKTDGTYVGTYQLPTKAAYSAFFYNPYLVVQPMGYSTMYVIDCNSMTLYGTISGCYQNGYQPWDSSGKYIYVRPTQYIDIVDIPNLTLTQTSYQGTPGYSGRSTAHATVGFANNGSSLFTSLQDMYYWTSGSNSSGYPLYIYSGSRSYSSSLLNSSQYEAGPGGNYSRNWGISCGNSNSIICSFGSNYYSAYPNGAIFGPHTPSSLNYGGSNYNVYFDSDDNNARCGVNNGSYYLTVGGAALTTYNYEWRIGYYPNGATQNGSTVQDCGIKLKSKTQGGTSSGPYYYVQDGTFMCQINNSGYVAVAYFDQETYGLNTTNIRIKILNGSTQVAQYTSSVSSSYVGGSSSYSRAALNGSGWTTNLLYSGTTYS